MQQGIPSPIRTYEFVEPSPIASQNNEPFNSNAANYLPPRNQKLPTSTNTYPFSKHQRPLQISQNLIQPPLKNQHQISDAAQFLSQNAQAISQLYNTPAANMNYEPFPENPNSQFQTFDASAINQGLQDSGGSNGFHQGDVPSYASGFLDSREALQQIRSMDKDHLIGQFQQALDNPVSTSARYAPNPTNNVHQNLLTSQGIQINTQLVGPQLDKPTNFNLGRPLDSGNSGYGQTSFLQSGDSPTSRFPITYRMQSTTPSTTTTTSTSQIPSVNSDGTLQIGTSGTPSGTSATYPYPHFGGFVPGIIGYPNFGTDFLGSSSDSGQSTGTSPTQFGIPIPGVQTSSHGVFGLSEPSGTQKPGTQVIPVQSIQTIPVNPVRAVYPIGPGVGQGQIPTYGSQPAVVNPLLIKPVKPVFPLYYPNVYQIQKPGLATFPWTYAPPYSQAKPAQIWK